MIGEAQDLRHEVDAAYDAGRADGLSAALAEIDEAIEEHYGATRHALRELRRRILAEAGKEVR